MHQLVNIRHSEPWREKVLFVDWLLGTRCNYSCSYCPQSLHDGSRPWLQTDVLLAFASRIIELCVAEGRQPYFQLIGGEVTLIPDLSRLLDSISSLGGRVGLISNGSRQLSWWREVREHLDFAILTYHPEHASVEHVKRVADLLSQTIRTHVNVAAPPDHFEQCVAVAEMLESSCTNISITLKPMLIDFGDQLYPYSEEQLAVFRNRRFRPPLTRPLVSVRGEMIAHYDDGKSEQMPATEFLTRGLNQWQGWSCNVGIELLSIKETGEVYRGLCLEGGKIGHVAHPAQFRLPQSPVVCTRNSCVCQTDIMVTRTRVPQNGDSDSQSPYSA